MDEDKQEENSHIDQKLHVRFDLTEVGCSEELYKVEDDIQHPEWIIYTNSLWKSLGFNLYF